MANLLGSSRQGRPQAEEATRAHARADAVADRDARAADKLDRIREHQPRDAGGDGEGGRGHEEHPREADAREGGRDYVRNPCCAPTAGSITDVWWNRERLREQNALSEEIVSAITTNAIGDTVDEDELDAELEELQQEQLDEQMLRTGNVPVSDEVHKMPTVANGEGKPLSLDSTFYSYDITDTGLTVGIVKAKPVEEEDDEEAELRKLQAEMAM